MRKRLPISWKMGNVAQGENYVIPRDSIYSVLWPPCFLDTQIFITTRSQHSEQRFGIFTPAILSGNHCRDSNQDLVDPEASLGDTISSRKAFSSRNTSLMVEMDFPWNSLTSSLFSAMETNWPWMKVNCRSEKRAWFSLTKSSRRILSLLIVWKRLKPCLNQAAAFLNSSA